MYQLTVEAADTVTVTDHPDRDAAHRQLMADVRRGDYYLRTLHTGPAATAYELLSLADGRRDPHRAGRAVIIDVDTPIVEIVT